MVQKGMRQWGGGVPPPPLQVVAVDWIFYCQQKVHRDIERDVLVRNCITMRTIQAQFDFDTYTLSVLQLAALNMLVDPALLHASSPCCVQ